MPCFFCGHALGEDGLTATTVEEFGSRTTTRSREVCSACASVFQPVACARCGGETTAGETHTVAFHGNEFVVCDECVTDPAPVP